VFVTTHYMDEAEYCGRLGLIYRGELIACRTPEALKSEMMREDIVEVACDRPQDAMEEVARVEGVRETALFGNALHVVTKDAERLIPALRREMETKGFRPTRVEKISPSLEDVFVSLIEERDRLEAPLGEVPR